MNLSKNWLADFVDVSDVDVKDYCDRMTDTGSKVEGYETEGEELSNIVVARIESLEKHPDSDHLQICQMDVGAEELVQIVTGAQNVFEGALVPAALHDSDLPCGVQAVIENGMLCFLHFW